MNIRINISVKSEFRLDTPVDAIQLSLNNNMNIVADVVKIISFNFILRKLNSFIQWNRDTIN